MNKDTRLQKELRVLELLATSKLPLSLQHIADCVSLAVPSTYRILQQLMNARLVDKNTNKTFSPSDALNNLAANVISNSQLLVERKLLLDTLSKKVEETCNLSVFRSGKVIYFDRVETPWPQKVVFNVGDQLPMCCTASGKLFLSFAERKYKVIELLNLKKHAKNTIVDKNAFKQEIKKITKQRISIDREEYLDNTIAIAVPVLLKKNTFPLFTLSVHAPTSRKTVDDLLGFVPDLEGVAQSIALLYGGEALPAND